MYVKAEGASLRVLARVPVAFLTEARLPIRPDRYLDLETVDAALATVAADIVRNLDAMDRDRPLPPPRVSWLVARRADKSFDSYDEARAHLEGPKPAADTAIDPTEAFVDFLIDYPAASSDGRYSLRVNGVRTVNRPSHTKVLYLLPAGGERRFVTSGAPRRIELTPDVRQVAATFARIGLDQLMSGVIHLLFVVCLALPPREVREARAALWILMATGAAGLGLSAVMPAPIGDAWLLTFQAVAGAALVVAALQNILTTRVVWVALAAGAFGLFDGLVVGAAYSQNMSFAGGHPIVALISFWLPIAIGTVWLFLVARPIVEFLYRIVPGRPQSELRERWAPLFLAAIPIHAGLHAVMNGL